MKKLMTNVKLLIIGLIFIFASGCEEGYTYLPTPVWISEIEVLDEFELSRLEVEVHLVDAETGRLLGCAGAHSGLEHVDYPNVFYNVDAEFLTPQGDLLYYEDIRNYDVEIWVIENDLDECPGPYVVNQDDIIGISPPIDGRDFRHFDDYGFGRVAQLRIGS